MPLLAAIVMPAQNFYRIAAIGGTYLPFKNPVCLIPPAKYAPVTVSLSSTLSVIGLLRSRFLRANCHFCTVFAIIFTVCPSSSDRSALSTMDCSLILAEVGLQGSLFLQKSCRYCCIFALIHVVRPSWSQYFIVRPWLWQTFVQRIVFLVKALEVVEIICKQRFARVLSDEVF